MTGVVFEGRARPNPSAYSTRTPSMSMMRAAPGKGRVACNLATSACGSPSSSFQLSSGVQGAFGLPYRSDREVRASMANDPIVRLRSFLVSTGVLTDAAADKIVDDVKTKVAASLEFARKSPPTKGERGVFKLLHEAPLRALAERAALDGRSGVIGLPLGDVLELGALHELVAAVKQHGDYAVREHGL